MVLRVELDRAAGGRHRGPGDEEVHQWVCAAAQAAGVEHGEIAVRLVDEAEGRTMNRHWRGKDHATNVLSFPAGESAQQLGDERPLGDLVICVPVVVREAGEQGKPPAHHWAHLLVHGTLHLFGYDHRHQDEALVMEALETRLLAQGGIPDPYRAGGICTEVEHEREDCLHE